MSDLKQTTNTSETGSNHTGGGPAPGSPSQSILRSVWDWVWPIGVGVIVALIVHQWVFTLSLVPSASMRPAIPNPCRLFVNKLSIEFGQPFRGEVVLFHFPDDPSQIFVKRIVGMPGDTVTVAENKVLINGKPLKEPYISQPNGSGLGVYHVPKGHYFMMGDNRPNSEDSRFWHHKYVARSAILGQAVAVIFPFSKISGIVQ